MTNVAWVLAYWPLFVLGIPLMAWLGHVTQPLVTAPEEIPKLAKFSFTEYARNGVLGGTMIFGVMLLLVFISR